MSSVALHCKQRRRQPPRYEGGDKMVTLILPRPSDFRKRPCDHNDTVLEKFGKVESFL